MSQSNPHHVTPEMIEKANSSISYVMYSVFATAAPFPAEERDKLASLAVQATSQAATVRGFYDVAGLRADADLMMWCHGDSLESVQDAYHALLNSELGGFLQPVWSAVGITRPAEFNRAHFPAYLTGKEPLRYICVYPFVRSYDWYVLDPQHRSQMLREHGEAAGPYPDVLAHTTSAFALGDYEWLLCFEAPAIERIVDMMRDLRAVEARLHVREELPFYTGIRMPLTEWVKRQPAV